MTASYLSPHFSPARAQSPIDQRRKHRVVSDSHGERTDEIADLLSVSPDSVERWTRLARREEKEALKAKAYDLWLNCQSYREIGEELGVAHTTSEDWCVAKATNVGNATPPES